MTRFVFITDTHLGAANDVGYRQQPRRADQLPALLALLDGWIRREAEGGAPISFVLHGGDMVDAAGPEILRAATETFRLSVPVYLSLGNHDVTRRDAADLWLSEAPAFFPGGEFAYALQWRRMDAPRRAHAVVRGTLLLGRRYSAHTCYPSTSTRWRRSWMPILA